MDGSIELVGACRYALRTFGTRAGLWGLVKEGAWLAAHIAVYPGGAVREQLQPAVGYRTDPLSPLRRSLVVTDPEAAGTPILLIHGIMDNRSVFTVFRRALRRRGFGVVHAVNYGLFTGDLREAAHELQRPRRAAVRGDRRRQGAHRRPLARRRHRPLLRPADGRLGARRHARHAGQPALRHPRRVPHPHGAGPPAAPRLAAAHRAGRARARLHHPVPGRVEPDGPDGRAAAQRAAAAPRPRRRPAGAARRRATWRCPIDGRVVRWVVEALVRSDRRHAASPATTPGARRGRRTRPPERHAGPGFDRAIGGRYVAGA